MSNIQVSPIHEKRLANLFAVNKFDLKMPEDERTDFLNGCLKLSTLFGPMAGDTEESANIYASYVTEPRPENRAELISLFTNVGFIMPVSAQQIVMDEFAEVCVGFIYYAQQYNNLNIFLSDRECTNFFNLMKEWTKRSEGRTRPRFISRYSEEKYKSLVYSLLAVHADYVFNQEGGVKSDEQTLTGLRRLNINIEGAGLLKENDFFKKRPEG